MVGPETKNPLLVLAVPEVVEVVETVVVAVTLRVACGVHFRQGAKKGVNMELPKPYFVLLMNVLRFDDLGRGSVRSPPEFTAHFHLSLVLLFD